MMKYIIYVVQRFSNFFRSTYVNKKLLHFPWKNLI